MEKEELDRLFGKRDPIVVASSVMYENDEEILFSHKMSVISSQGQVCILNTKEVEEERSREGSGKRKKKK